MKGVKRILALLMLTAVFTAMAAPPCWACTCAPDMSKKDYAKNADVIFTGVVEEIIDTDPSSATDPLKVRFTVNKVYKGYPKETTHVFTSEWGSMCGATFKVGTKYTVFADRNEDGKKTTSMCSGNKKGGINPDLYGLPDAYPPQDA